ncbi:MAG: Fic family protein [Phycisphaerae bacterium]|nr:Fic family protein [Phycisphaerae bacterium]
MDVNAFSEFKSGRLVPINAGRHSDYAFVPDPLPPSIVTNDAHWPLLLAAHKKLARLDVMAAELPDLNLLLRPLQRREAMTSNSLEGTFVAPEELLLFEAQDSKASDEGKRNDWLEVAAYDTALTRGCELIRDGHRITKAMMLQLHRLLMDGSVRGRERRPGEFRTKQVVVGANRRYVPPPPEELAAALANFEVFMVTPPSEIDPLIAAYVAHYQFEAIHPFEDGNGRLGRLLLALCNYQWLALNTPCLYMSEFFERNRKDYIWHLSRISTHGEWRDWIDFCLRGTIEQADDSMRRCEVLRGLRKAYLARLGAKSDKSVLLLDDLFKSPFITVIEVKKKFDVTYPTAKSYLERLVAEGVITEMKDRSLRTYVAREIFDAAYGD